MRILIRFLIGLLALSALPSSAEPIDASKLFDGARAQLADMRKQLATGDLDSARLDALRSQNNELVGRAQALIDERTPLLDALDARSAELGPLPQDGTREAADIGAQRKDLERQRASTDADLRRARLILVDAAQISAAISQARRASFLGHLSQRTASPLTATFWRELDGNLDRDRAALQALLAQTRTSFERSFAAANLPRALGAGALGLGVLCLLPWLTRRVLVPRIAARLQAGRLRRSLAAFLIAAGTTLGAWLGASILLGWSDADASADDSTRVLRTALVTAMLWGGFVAGIGSGLLSPTRPSWRLAPIDDAIARRLRALPWLLGAAVGCAIVIHHFYQLAGAGVSATMLGSLCLGVLYALIVGWGLLRMTHHATTPPEEVTRPAWIGAVIAIAWAAVLAVLVSAATGYIALAYQLAQQLVGGIVVAALLYLLVCFIEDLFAAAVHSRSAWLTRSLGLGQRTLDQWAVLGTGLLRLAAMTLGLLAVLAPLGADPGELVDRVLRRGNTLGIGSFSFTPSAVVGAALALVVGVALVRGVQHWLRHTYLPTTRLDAAMRDSITTLLGWLGIVVVVGIALAALGLSLERIAWIASALSVGIGFGLQAIVQNFVSGLILLVERPVKVGDWVVLGDVEGDIRRIKVRATEIQLADRSTVIVPNSELVTKSVRNVTLANADGRVRFLLPLPLGSDAAHVREIVLQAVAAHAEVLERPAPSVLLDGIAGGALVFAVAAYIANPRRLASVRSELLLEILACLRSNDIALSSPLQVVSSGGTRD